MELFHISNVPHKELTTSSGEVLSKSAVLSELFGYQKIFVHHEILEIGKRASASHFHTKQEEMVFVLEGTPTAYQGTTFTQLHPGDFIGFKPGNPESHFIENKSDTIVRLLVISSIEEDDKVVYD